jgi:hypothetical protein
MINGQVNEEMKQDGSSSSIGPWSKSDIMSKIPTTATNIDTSIVNLENIIKESKSLRKISGDIRSESFLLLVLISFFDKNLNKFGLEKKKIMDLLFISEFPFIIRKNFKLSEFNVNKIDNFTLREEIFSRNIFNFYQDNYLVRSSKNFKFCLDNLKQVKFKKKNVV